MSNHYVQKCEKCGAVIAQCRCMACDKTVVVKGLCSKCAAQPQDKGSAGQQSAIAVQQRKGKIIAFDSLDHTVTIKLYAGCDGLVMGEAAAITSPVA